MYVTHVMYTRLVYMLCSGTACTDVGQGWSPHGGDTFLRDPGIPFFVLVILLL